ncbi:MAG: family 16 glycoside hydrolase, partial [Armatimonadota bacterium]
MYELILASGELALVRVVGQQRQTLGGSPYQLRPGQWHNMIVRVANGQIQLIVDGQAAITSRDAQPLPAGFVGFGCLEGGSCAYDDISVAPGGSGAAMQPLAGVIQPPGTVQMQPMMGVVQPTPGVQAPGTVPMQPMVGVPPPAGALSENFERQPLQGWEFGGAQVQPVELGHALVCPGTGHGIWVAASARDFALRFRYRQGQGVGQVVLCAFGEPPQNREYQVMLSQGEMALVRNVQGQPQELGGGQCQLQPGQWYDVVIRIANGQIQVAVGGQTVLTAQDAQPLPAGTFAFGCIEGGGVAYDDITLTPSGGGAGPQPPLGIAQPLPGVAQPGGVQVQPIPGVLQPGPGARSENFETQPLQGWEIGGNVQVAPAGQSRALVCSGPGHGYWLAGAARDFALRFRYQHGQGLGEVILCASGEPPNGRAYHLMLHAGLLGLDRNVGGQRQRLAEAQWAVQPGQWYDIAVQLANGQMQVSMGGQPVLTVQDPQPLPGGAIGFGCAEGGGFAYDNI